MGKKHRTQLEARTRSVSDVPALAEERKVAERVTQIIAIQANAYPLTVVEAAGISAVRRCVSLIANAVAGQPWQEWDGDMPVDPVSNLVRRPAAIMSRREWVWRCISQMALQEIVYLRMIGGVDDEGIPGSLIPMPTEAVAPAGFIDPFGIFPPTRYSISGVPGTVSGEEIIPMRSAFWPGVPVHLVGLLKMARNSMMQAWASDVYGSRYWQAGGAPVTQIVTEQELTNTQADNMGDRWVTRRSKGPDFPAVFGKGAEAKPYGADISNAVAVEARREITVEIANLFGVPARYVNVVPTGNSQTYANLNDEALSLERFTLAGFTDPIQDVVSDLLPEERFMRIDMSRFTRASQESRYRAWQIATGSKPWMLPSEVRAEEGMTPNADIDTFEEAAVAGAEAFVEDGGRPPATAEPEPEREEADAPA